MFRDLIIAICSYSTSPADCTVNYTEAVDAMVEVGVPDDEITELLADARLNASTIENLVEDEFPPYWESWPTKPNGGGHDYSPGQPYSGGPEYDGGIFPWFPWIPPFWKPKPDPCTLPPPWGFPKIPYGNAECPCADSPGDLSINAIMLEVDFDPQGPGEVAECTVRPFGIADPDTPKCAVSLYYAKHATEQAKIVARRLHTNFPAFQQDPNDINNSPAGAFKHAYWSSLMSWKFGPGFADRIMDAHERVDVVQIDERAMDLYNNEVSYEMMKRLRRSGAVIDEHVLVQVIIDDLGAGKYITKLPGSVCR